MKKSNEPLAPNISLLKLLYCTSYIKYSKISMLLEDTLVFYNKNKYNQLFGYYIISKTEIESSSDNNIMHILSCTIK